MARISLALLIGIAVVTSAACTGGGHMKTEEGTKAASPPTSAPRDEWAGASKAAEEGAGEVDVPDTAPEASPGRALADMKESDVVARVNGEEISRKKLSDFVIDWYWEKPLKEMVVRAMTRRKGLLSDMDDNAALVVVNGEEITKAKLIELVCSNNEYWDNPLENMIRETLIRQEVERLGITSSPAETDERIEKEIERRKEHLKATGDNRTFEDVLAEEGETLESFKQELRDSKDLFLYIALEKLVKYEETCEEQVTVRHIILPMEERQKAEEIAKKLKEGADFERLARDESQDAAAANGGLLPPFGRGVMVKEFEDAAFALAPGQVSDVVESRVGLHIIRGESRRARRDATYNEIREEVWKEIMEKGVSERRIARWVEALYQRSRVDILVK